MIIMFSTIVHARLDSQNISLIGTEKDYVSIWDRISSFAEKNGELKFYYTSFSAGKLGSWYPNVADAEMIRALCVRWYRTVCKNGRKPGNSRTGRKRLGSDCEMRKN